MKHLVQNWMVTDETLLQDWDRSQTTPNAGLCQVRGEPLMRDWAGSDIR